MYETLPFEGEDERKDVKKTLDYLEEHFVGRQNTIYERWRFNSRNQEVVESFQLYLSELRQIAQKCELE